ncbi:MAG: hypothetical protein JO329_11975 [Planctomycetaceae bacterium]|jgi:hypothetical protein|nr:hypothetical protein [Planctomycetaceae bacterium]MBV8268321.1 hypothetical protein [Planctomycetaceae bacterium]MBV8316284.1 hypothetical protein [Planctomycetaceae bacterium]MBV8557962.1 hypothetical protein [Planctomycetaceae bacterium]
MEKTTFHYQPKCTAPKCDKDAVYKIAATWSNSTSRELKNYGLACEDHRDSQLALAQLHRQGLKLAEGEAVGQVGLYQLVPGRRDTELTRLPDH